MLEARSAKKWMGYGGTALGLFGIIFVALRLADYRQSLNLSELSASVWALFGVSVLIYAGVNVFLARAWWYILAYLRLDLKWSRALSVYSRSQLAKYVPGNIFHLAGRQVLGLAAGLPGRPLAKSIAGELGLLVLAGAMFSVLVGPVLGVPFSTLWATLSFVTLLAAAFQLISRVVSPQIAYAFGCQVLFLVVTGAIFFGVASSISDNGFDVGYLPLYGGSYVVAWLIGLVTPGAPAGVGVRELVLLFLLSGTVAQSELLVATVVCRAITVLGDLIFFAWYGGFFGIKCNAQMDEG